MPQPSYRIDPLTLREVINDVEAVESRILALEEIGRTGDAERIGWLRMSGRLSEAEALARQALQERAGAHDAREPVDPLPYTAVSAALRLAHVLHWQDRFDQAHHLFALVLESISAEQSATVQDEQIAHSLKAFALQHQGKAYFDQGQFSEALSCFQNALKLRKADNAAADQLESTLLAIRVVEARLLN